MSAPPIRFQWDGEAMVPAGAAMAKKADDEFVVGETYTLVQHQDRSQASHNRYFAHIHDLWESLPDHLAMEFPSADHLRKWALAKAGYADKQTIVCESVKEARKVATGFKGADLFSLVDISGNVVTVWTAHSQSFRAMGKATFHESVEKAEREIEALIASTRRGRAA